ncbi:methylated-DNA--[protein]-cysteine S-methyltransferase [Clostridium perfringens]|nr:methylated-DNA--[protein]-cysteine S-methyltransferase [Clostridium perfringens]
MKENLINKGYYNSPIGVLEIVESDGFIVEINFVQEANCLEDSSSEEIKKCKKELEEYFEGKRTDFTVKINFAKGTDFQKSVWNALKKIPYGKTVSYKDIAEEIGNPKGFRAVGGANNKNPIAIIVPCHRVIGKNGSLTGYADGLSKKEYLLDIERKKERDFE